MTWPNETLTRVKHKIDIIHNLSLLCHVSANSTISLWQGRSWATRFHHRFFRGELFRGTWSHVWHVCLDHGRAFSLYFLVVGSSFIIEGSDVGERWLVKIEGEGGVQYLVGLLMSDVDVDFCGVALFVINCGLVRPLCLRVNYSVSKSYYRQPYSFDFPPGFFGCY